MVHTAESLAARQAIYDAILLYARGLDRLDAELVASVYHPDGIDHNGLPDAVSPVTGRQFATDTVAKLGRMFISTSHLIHNTLIEVDGEQARSEAYYTAWHRSRAADGSHSDLVIAGRYLDRFELRAGAWKIARRWRTRDWSRIDPVHEISPPAPGWLMAQRSRADPLYTLPLAKVLQAGTNGDRSGMGI